MNLKWFLSLNTCTIIYGHWISCRHDAPDLWCRTMDQTSLIPVLLVMGCATVALHFCTFFCLSLYIFALKQIAEISSSRAGLWNPICMRCASLWLLYYNNYGISAKYYFTHTVDLTSEEDMVKTSWYKFKVAHQDLWPNWQLIQHKGRTSPLLCLQEQRVCLQLNARL